MILKNYSLWCVNISNFASVLVDVHGAPNVNSKNTQMPLINKELDLVLTQTMGKIIASMAFVQYLHKSDLPNIRNAFT